MSERDSVAKTAIDAPLDPPEGAEGKRLAARRRFLGRSAAAGTGLLIVTLFHRRAFAWTNYTKERLVSGIEECHSWGGKHAYLETNKGKAVVYNSPAGYNKKNSTERFNCIKG